MKIIKFNPSGLHIDIKDDVIDIFNKYRQLNKNDSEKGGVLMGKLFPLSNKIVITHALICKNQKSSKYSLKLNTKCLQKKIEKIWNDSGGTITYLGDWHTHPENDPKPSIVDFKTFVLNYYTSKFDQNILLYFILGNKKKDLIKSFNGFVFCTLSEIL